MLRGAFIRADGLVIPNNITVAGSAAILASFTRLTAQAFTVALCNCVPDPLLAIADLKEPSAFNGYSRKVVTQDAAGWPTLGTLNGESYVETDYIEWTAVGGPFDKAVTRLALIVGDNVLALSGAMPSELTIDVDTDVLSRKFVYRIYLR